MGVSYKLSSGGATIYTEGGLTTGLGISSAGNTRFFGPIGIVPNVGQQIFYNWTVSLGSAQSLILWVRGYKVPNGAE